MFLSFPLALLLTYVDLSLVLVLRFNIYHIALKLSILRSMPQQNAFGHSPNPENIKMEEVDLQTKELN